jgi:hypothetical protein
LRDCGRVAAPAAPVNPQGVSRSYRCGDRDVAARLFLSIRKTNEKERTMKLITKELRRRLLQNGEIRRKLDEDGEADSDFYPVVKLFMPDGAGTWILTEVDPDYPETAIGLCDLGMGCPELGSVYLCELEAVRGVLGLPVERDLHFNPDFTISVYARAALKAGRIVEDRASLEQALTEQREARQIAEGGAP